MAKRKTPKIERRSARTKQKRRFILFCEGRNTEPDYFDAIQRSLKSTLISIEPIGGVGVPKTIAGKAVQRARNLGLLKNSRRRKYSFEENDEVWAVFDRDEHHGYLEAIRLCKEKGIGIAASNPCFELWLILHETDYDKPDGHQAVQKQLERIRSDYSRKRNKSPDCDEMVSRVVEAEERAKELLSRRRDEGSPHGAPSTTVGELTKRIREANQLAGRKR